MTETLTMIALETPYRVLARQYRPQKLSELVGQELLVKTLAQGIERNRLPHAFLLHGIGGVGKNNDGAYSCQGIELSWYRRKRDPNAKPLWRV